MAIPGILWQKKLVTQLVLLLVSTAAAPPNFQENQSSRVQEITLFPGHFHFNALSDVQPADTDGTRAAEQRPTTAHPAVIDEEHQSQTNDIHDPGEDGGNSSDIDGTHTTEQRPTSIRSQQPVQDNANNMGIFQAAEEYVKNTTWNIPHEERLTIDSIQLPPDVERLCEVNGPDLDCSFRKLSAVPNFTNYFPHITNLNLKSNFINRICDNAFEKFPRLLYLDISVNNISILEPNAFANLSHLRRLNLWCNLLTMTHGRFPPDVFVHLYSLEKLFINRNSPDLKTQNYGYPDEALSRLTNLTDLSMDGLRNTDFGPGFQNMISLRNLSLAGYHDGYCFMNSLRNSTFQYLSQLQHLNLSNCYILGKNIQPGTFLTLPNLVSLDLTHNEDIDIPYLNNVFYGLGHTVTLKKLYMRLIVNRYSLGICLDSYFIRNFPRHLEYFNAGENNIEAVDRHVISLLSPSLKVLHVGANRFVFGTYLKDLHLMKNLTTLVVSGGGFTYNLPDRYPFQMPKYGSSFSNCTLYDRPGDFMSNEDFYLKLPPNLKSLEMSKADLTYTLSKLTVDPNNFLENLTMRENKFPSLEGPFYGLNRLRLLDLSRSFVGNISRNFFRNLSNLEILNLESNLLGDFLSHQWDSGVFSDLIHLKTLNLSFNDICSLSVNVFAGLNSLEKLLLRKNPLAEFVADISHMERLVYLDLTSTRIAKFSELTTNHIDQLEHHNISIHISLVDAPIHCDCSNLPFLTWMTHSRAFDRRFTDYKCINPDTSSKVITDGYNSTLETLNRQCGSHAITFFCVGACTVLTFGIIVGAILYRFRWKIRYLYYAAYLYYKRKGVNNKAAEFPFDAFICYANDDEDFVLSKLSFELEKRGLKLCIHGRDFTAGDYIASNIVKAVCKSRRTVVVLTRNMLRSYWCGYEIKMANMESVHSGRRVLVFLLMETVPESELGVELLYNIRTNTYIPYPNPLPDATSMGKLWDKLATDIND